MQELVDMSCLVRQLFFLFPDCVNCTFSFLFPELFGPCLAFVFFSSLHDHKTSG